MSVIDTIKNYFVRARDEAEIAHCPGTENGAWQTDAAAPRAWIGVDLDGTLSHYDPEMPLSEIGPPVTPMLETVKKMLADGCRVKIFTARAADPDQLPLIQRWLRKNGLPPLEITNTKDFNMISLYDDRSIRVEQNTGRIISGQPKEGEDSFRK